MFRDIVIYSTTGTHKKTENWGNYASISMKIIAKTNFRSSNTRKWKKVIKLDYRPITREKIENCKWNYRYIVNRPLFLKLYNVCSNFLNLKRIYMLHTQP